MYRPLLASVLMLLSLTLCAEEYSVTSPDGHLKATIHLVDGKLSYSINRDSRTIVNESPLGLKTSVVDLQLRVRRTILKTKGRTDLRNNLSNSILLLIGQ